MALALDDRRGVAWLDLVRASTATIALYVSGFVLPFGGPLLMLLSPQPGLRLYQSRGMKPVVALAVLVTLLVYALAGPEAAVFYMLGFGLVSVLLPLTLEREWSIEATVGVVTSAVATALLAAAVVVSNPVDWLGSMRGSLEQIREEAMRVYARAGLPADVLAEVEAGGARLIELMLRLSPALFLGAIATVVLLNLELLRRRQRASGIVPVFGDLTRWKCPPELVWILIASGYCMFLPAGISQMLAMNVFALLAGVYFCQGLVIAQFYMRRWHSPYWVNGLVYVFILVEWLLATGVTLLGVFDLWADFRRLNPRPVEED